jgi:hypothetical protein
MDTSEDALRVFLPHRFHERLYRKAQNSEAALGTNLQAGLIFEAVGTHWQVECREIWSYLDTLTYICIGGLSGCKHILVRNQLRLAVRSTNVSHVTLVCQLIGTDNHRSIIDLYCHGDLEEHRHVSLPGLACRQTVERRQCSSHALPHRVVIWTCSHQYSSSFYLSGSLISAFCIFEQRHNEVGRCYRPTVDHCSPRAV